MILGKKNRLKFSLKIGSITIKESDEVELLEITIDKALNLKKTYRKFMLHFAYWIRDSVSLIRPFYNFRDVLGLYINFK